jgi:hypothetical protein
VVVLVNLLTATSAKLIHPSAGAAAVVAAKRRKFSNQNLTRGRNRTCKALPKCANTDSELRWKEQTRTVQKPAFSRVPGINTNVHITQDGSPWDIFEIFFSPEMFILIQTETNRYAMQQINKKPSNGRTSVMSFS